MKILRVILVQRDYMPALSDGGGGGGINFRGIFINLPPFFIYFITGKSEFKSDSRADVTSSHVISLY